MSQQPPNNQFPQDQQGQPQYPQGQYPPQGYGQMPMPQQPPKRKRGRGLLITGIVVAVLLFGCIGASYAASRGATTTSDASSTTSGTSANAMSPTTAPVQQKWTTTHTIKGTGIKKTETLTLAEDWKLLWTCDPTSFTGGQYNLIVTVYGADNTPKDVAINAICKAGATSGFTEEHSGGAVYLDVNSEGDWTVQLQEQK